MSATTWAVERTEGPAGWLHDAGLPVPDRRLVRAAVASAPALVLGSTQPAADADPVAAAALGIEVVRRRSGGGAVLVDPSTIAWVDVCLPREDPRWDDDVARAAWWVGEAWRRALSELGVAGATVHQGGLVSTAWSRRVCFAGIGPGEVRVGERKIVGLSQRRTRAGAVFQTAVHVRWDPRRLVDCLALAREDRPPAVTELNGVAVGFADLGVAAPQPDVLAVLLTELDRAG